MSHPSRLAWLGFSVVVIAVCGSAHGAAPGMVTKPTKEVPKVVMENLRMEGQVVSKEPIELSRNKFLPIDADLEAGAWGFTRTPCFQFTYVPQGGEPSTFPDQIFTHPVVVTDPCLSFSVAIYRGDKLIKENIVGGTLGLFGNEAKPWQGKVRYWFSTPDQPGEYTLQFRVSDVKADGIIGAPEKTFELGTQRIIVR